jgi:hypothetical protein
MDIFEQYNICIFVAGSLGRLDFGAKSDIDFFLISKNEISRLKTLEVFGKLLDYNKEKNFPEFSNDGKFLKIHCLDHLISHTGSPTDDHENLFTTRMLLLLESHVVSNEKLYDESINKIIEHYYKDEEGHLNFFPIFLLNDILRYWRTLCLNYEMIRQGNKPWRKKNINLKYSRMLTVFSTIIPMVTVPNASQKFLLDLTKKTPLEKLAIGLDCLGTDKYKERFVDFVNLYEYFVSAKETFDIDINIGLKKELDENADVFSDFMYDVLSDEKISKRLRKILVL